MTRTTPKPPLTARAAHARREVAYWAARGARTALRAAQRHLNNNTGWGILGTALLGGGLISWVWSCPLWYHDHPGRLAITAGIFAAVGILLLFVHGIAKDGR